MYKIFVLSFPSLSNYPHCQTFVCVLGQICREHHSDNGESLRDKERGVSEGDTSQAYRLELHLTLARGTGN